MSYQTTSVNVLTKGAKGDGITDDAAAITAAITAASSTGGTVLFPSGTYLIASTVNLASNVRLVGLGTGTSIISPHGTFPTGGYIFQDPSAITNVSVEGLTFDMKSQNAIAFRFFRSGTSHVSVERCEIKNMPALANYNATQLNNVTDVMLLGNRIIGPTGTASVYGIGITSTASKIAILDNYIYGFDTTIDGGGSHMVVHGNRFEQSGHWCVVADGCSYASITGNDFNGSWYPGNPATADGASAAAARGGARWVTISGNTAYQLEYSCYASSDVVISDNVTNGAFNSGIEINNATVAGATQRVTCSGNKVYGAQGSGIYLTGDHLIAIGNTVEFCGYSGIKAAAGTIGASGISIIGNHCLNNGQGGISSNGDGIRIGNPGDSASFPYITIANNICTDTQGTKTQGYGLIIASTLVNNIQSWGNRFEGNSTGTVSDVSTNLVYGVDTTSTQTLTSKTLTSPAITTPTITGTPKINGAWDTTNSTRAVAFSAPVSATNYLSIAGSTVNPSIAAIGSSTDIGLELYPKGAGLIYLKDGNGLNVVRSGGIASAVNYFTLGNNTTGNAPYIQATGTDTDISINLLPKGAGTLKSGGTNVLLTGGALGVPSSGTLTNCTGLPVTAITPSTAAALGVGSLEVGNASDTTVSRLSAGTIGVEGVEVMTSNRVINPQVGTTYTLALADAGHLVTLNNAAAITLTVPTNATVAFPVGSYIDLAQLGSGQVTIAGTGVTFNARLGTKISTQYGGVRLTKLATDTWLITGDLSA